MDVKQIGDPSARPRGDGQGPGGSGGFSRLLGAIGFAVVLGVGFMFSLLLFSILLVAGVVVGGWWWWKTRHLRRELRERMAQMAQQAQNAQDIQEAEAGGRIIEGEVIRDPGDRQ